jgi:hypothetical protein
MSPQEAQKAKHLIGLALSMIEMEKVPEFIKSTPFVVRIFPHKVFALERTDEAGSVPFRNAEGDDLITTIQMAVDMTINEQTHGRAVKSATSVVNTSIASNEPL